MKKYTEILERIDCKSESWIDGFAAAAATAGAGVAVAGVAAAGVAAAGGVSDAAVLAGVGLVLPVPAAWRLRPLPPPPPAPPSREARPGRMPPKSCISWGWVMLLRRFCSSESPRLLKSRPGGKTPPRPPPLPPPDL